MAGNLVDALKSMGQMPKVLILRMRLVPYLDATGESALETVFKQCRDNNTQVILSGVQPQPMRMFHNANISEGKAGVVFCPNYEAALEKAKSLMSGEDVRRDA